jgi:23S rRNA (adenine-N6)-dimethyltransferase
MKRLVANYSQHFLRNTHLIGELVGHSNIRKNDTVIDIGAGSGAITVVLSRRCAQVFAYEAEPVAAKKLRQNMSNLTNVTVVEQDFLRADLPEVPYKVFANIPFSLSSEIVRKLCKAARPPKSIYLVLQKQFAQKLIVEGNHFHGALGMTIAPWWTTRIRRPLKRTDFTPPPAVDTVLLEIKRREEPLLAPEHMSAYGKFVEQCYAEPRLYARTTAPRTLKPSQLTPTQWVEAYRSSRIKPN